MCVSFQEATHHFFYLIIWYFNNFPEVRSGAVNEPLSLRFGNASLEAGKALTFGMAILCE